VYAFVEATGEGERSEFNEFVKRLDVLHTEYVHKQVGVRGTVVQNREPLLMLCVTAHVHSAH
jgi:hypothetical protein